jgi:hypothetical protein
MIYSFMKEYIKPALLFLAGILTGLILTIGIKYPFTLTELEKAQKICKDQKILKIKIGITGNIYEVTCDDKITYLIKN